MPEEARKIYEKYLSEWKIIHPDVPFKKTMFYHVMKLLYGDYI